jgi:hypothetical protein
MLKSSGLWRAGALCAVLAVAGCTNTTTPTNPTTPLSTATTEFFASVLDVGGFAWRSIETKRIGKVTVRLSVFDFDSEAVAGLGLGTFDGTKCELIESVEAKPQLLDPQITRALTAGNYCVKVWDIGNLTRANRFVIVIELP